uniref:Uncharacterized protein n=1 Tax=Romanomermis culicivorax TaxID=13658 RepID=A0A915KG82_ROMCU
MKKVLLDSRSLVCSRPMENSHIWEYDQLGVAHMIKKFALRYATVETYSKNFLMKNLAILIQYGPSGRILNQTDSKVGHLSIDEKFDADPFGDRETKNSDLAVIKSQKMISAMKPLILSNVELSDVSKCQSCDYPDNLTYDE